MWSQLSFVLPRMLRRHLLLSQIRIDEQVLDGVRVKLAETENEALGAARLVHDAYVARGILPPHRTRLHVTRLSAAPGTWTFVAARGDQVIATMSLTCDAGEGLPMDKVYGREVDTLRERGEHLAEVNSFAVTPEFRRSGVAFWLNRIMSRTAIRLGVDRLVIAVHPRAEDLYRETLLFERLGDERVYPGLNESARAVALSLPIRTFEQDLHRAFGHLGPRPCNPHWLLFGSEIPEIEEPARLDGTLPARRVLRKALAKARPDVVQPRPSLVSYTNESALA